MESLCGLCLVFWNMFGTEQELPWTDVPWGKRRGSSSSGDAWLGAKRSFYLEETLALSIVGCSDFSWSCSLTRRAEGEFTEPRWRLCWGLEMWAGCQGSSVATWEAIRKQGSRLNVGYVHFRIQTFGTEDDASPGLECMASFPAASMTFLFLPLLFLHSMMLEVKEFRGRRREEWGRLGEKPKW